jgi:hypothetical protein
MRTASDDHGVVSVIIFMGTHNPLCFFFPELVKHLATSQDRYNFIGTAGVRASKEF